MRLLFILTANLMALFAQGSSPLPYASAPNDPYWPQLWHLENIDTNGVRRGVDVNARAAWALSKGAGVQIVIVDDGVETSHPDMVANHDPALDWNFNSDTPSGTHESDFYRHGTSVAGLAVATANNARGISGTAPGARFGSWVIYLPTGPLIDSNKMAQVFDYKMDVVDIQNHSWLRPAGRRSGAFIPMSSAEDLAISNAVTAGRGGKGVIMVRAAGNDRVTFGRNVNENAFTSDPRAITVAAVRYEGRVATYSNPGAAILVSAPSGDSSFGGQSLFVTDRVGTLGYNSIIFPTVPDLNDYAFNSLGFSGTSGAAPIISGIVALMLSANPELTWRDVQQVLIHSAFQSDENDHDTRLNSAGFRVSHNTGFGVVNAATAVDTAQRWKNRPPATSVSASDSRPVEPIPDGALFLSARTSDGQTTKILAAPGFGAHIDDTAGTEFLPVVPLENPLGTLDLDLHGKIALIRYRFTNDPPEFPPYAAMIQAVADAGAELAVIYRNTGGNDVRLLDDTYFSPIPSFAIAQNAGELLRASVESDPGLRVRGALEGVEYSFNIADSLLCEHVIVRAKVVHPIVGDLRASLRAPSGTRSVLKQFSHESLSVSNEWSFMSTHHFYESASGQWTVEFSDEAQGSVGTVENVSIEIRGVRIVDLDRDGLDDVWEITHLGSLSSGAAHDPDKDGYSNMREQILGTNPLVNENDFSIGVAHFDADTLRLNWPARDGSTYQVLGASTVTEVFQVITNISGTFPRSGWFGDMASPYQFFQVRESE